MTTQLASEKRDGQSLADPSASDEGPPPGPRLPRALQTALWAARPLAFMDRARRRYGPVFTIRPYGFAPVAVLADPGHIKEVFTGDRDVFAAGPANAAMGPAPRRHS